VAAELLIYLPAAALEALAILFGCRGGRYGRNRRRRVSVRQRSDQIQLHQLAVESQAGYAE
jgi:hypothetical protein